MELKCMDVLVVRLVQKEMNQEGEESVLGEGRARRCCQGSSDKVMFKQR